MTQPRRGRPGSRGGDPGVGLRQTARPASMLTASTGDGLDAEARHRERIRCRRPSWFARSCCSKAGAAGPASSNVFLTGFPYRRAHAERFGRPRGPPASAGVVGRRLRLRPADCAIAFTMWRHAVARKRMAPIRTPLILSRRRQVQPPRKPDVRERRRRPGNSQCDFAGCRGCAERSASLFISQPPMARASCAYYPLGDARPNKLPLPITCWSFVL